MYWTISWSISSPATRKERETTTPPIDKAATSVDVDNHAAADLCDRQACAESSCHRLFNQPDFTGSGRHGCIVNGPLLDFCNSGGDTDDDSRARYRDKTLLVCFTDEIFKHRLGDLELGDHAVSQGSHSDNVGWSPPDHFLGFRSDCLRFPGSFIDSHPRRFSDDDPLTTHVDERIGGSQVNSDVKRKKTQKPVEGIESQIGLLF
jgi:hypothetical protein